MDIKIVCSCGAHFAFEVEPEDGHMPVQVACPECGADATSLANEQIAAATPPPAAPAPAPARKAVRIGAAPAAPPPPADAVSEESPLARCAKHATEVSVAECSVCGKPMCQDCVDQFGFVCSVYCRQQAENRGIEIPQYAGTKARTRDRERRKELRILKAIPVALALLAGAWAYYFFYASRPRVAWRLETAGDQRFAHATWQDDGRVLALHDKRLVLMDAAKGREVWNVVPKPEETLPRDAGAPPLALGRDAAWAVFNQRVVKFQLTDGQRKLEIPLPGAPEQLAWSESTLVVSTRSGDDKEVVGWVDLASGQLKSETFNLPVVRPVTMDTLLETDDSPGPTGSPFASRVVATPRGAARLTLRLLQAGYVPVTAPGQRAAASSVLDSDTLRAGDSDRAGAEFLRNTAETRRLDVSRYATTIRWLGASPSEWRGETIGRPALFPLGTGTALIAGTNLHWFGPSGERRWESRLAYPVDEVFTSEASAFPAGPCRELGGRLYVADLANLTAFDLATGQVQWRVQAIGIRDIQPASGGGLYVTATTAGPGAIVYYNPKEADVTVEPLLLRLDGAGQILWQAAGYGDRVLASGKFLYVTRAQSSKFDELQAALGGGDAPVHFRVHRLDPRDGRLVWEYYQPRAPRAAAARQNRFFLLYRDELQLVSFFAF